MPDRSIPTVRFEMTVLCISPSTGAVKVNPAFHYTIFKIEQAVLHIPGAHGIATPGFKVTVDGFETRAIHSAHRHLVSALAYFSLMHCCIQWTSYHGILFPVEAMTINNGKI